MKNEEERPLKVIWEVFSILQFLREVAGVSSLGEGLELPPAVRECRWLSMEAGEVWI